MRLSSCATCLLLCAALSTRALAQGAPPAKPAPAAPAAPATPAAPAATPAAPPAAPAAPAPAAPVPEPTSEQRDIARAAYDRGRKLFGEAKYADARAAFQEAYDAVPNPIVLVSIGECQLRLGNLEDAYDAFARYLEGRPDAPDRADVEKKLADITATPATLVITTAPAGAAICLDGQDTGKVTPAEVPVPRGDHTLELTLAGHTALSEPVNAKAGVRHELHAELQPLPPPPVAVAPPPPPPPPPPEPPTEAIWITGIVGATGIIAGTVLGFVALSERSDYDANPTAESADRGERLALFADVAFGVGAMGALTALVLYVTSDDEPEPPATDSTEPAGPSATLTPVLGPSHIGVVAGGRF